MHYKDQYVIMNDEPKLISLKELILTCIEENVEYKNISTLMNLRKYEEVYDIKLDQSPDIQIIIRVI